MGDFPWFRDPPRRTHIIDFVSLHEAIKPPKSTVEVNHSRSSSGEGDSKQSSPNASSNNSSHEAAKEKSSSLTMTVPSPELISSFNACIDIRERQYQFRTVRNCFIGKEAVTAMIRAGIAADKMQAIEIGNLLLSHDVFRHASDVKEDFKDDYVFYRLTPKAAAKKGRLRSLQAIAPPKTLAEAEASDPLSLSLRKGLSPVPVSHKSPSAQDNVKKIKNFCNAANNPTTSLCLQGADLTLAQALSIAECMRSQKLLSLVFSSLFFGNASDPDASPGLAALERLLASLGGLSLHALVLQDLRFQGPPQSLPLSIVKQLISLCAQLNLRSLSLNKCQLDEQAGKMIGALLATNTTLTHLDISHNILGPKGVELLVGSLGSNSTLLSLNLANNNAGKGGADALSKALVVNSGLVLLDLQTNELGDEGCSLLVQGLGRNNTLTAIDLRSNGITDTGAMIFQAVFSTNFCLVEVSIFGHLMYSPKSVTCEAFTERNKRLKVLTRPTARGNAGGSGGGSEEPEIEEELDDDADEDDIDESIVIKNLDLEKAPIQDSPSSDEWDISRTRARGVVYAGPDTHPGSISRPRIPTQSGYVYGRVLQNAGWGADGLSFFGTGEAGRARTLAVGGESVSAAFTASKFAGKTPDQLIAIIQQQHEQIEQQTNQIVSLKIRNEELTSQMAKDKDSSHAPSKEHHQILVKDGPHAPAKEGPHAPHAPAKEGPHAPAKPRPPPLPGRVPSKPVVA